jgi:hypothetical protein
MNAIILLLLLALGFCFIEIFAPGGIFAAFAALFVVTASVIGFSEYGVRVGLYILLPAVLGCLRRSSRCGSSAPSRRSSPPSKAGIKLDFDRACAIDLATKGTGKSVLEAVRTSVNPKVIDCPNPASGRNTIDGVAKDGIQVKVRARVTVRTNLDRFVGGAQGGNHHRPRRRRHRHHHRLRRELQGRARKPRSHLQERPHRGLDVGTAFEILSIDIADVDVGENVGAKLQEAQAEANKNMAQAQAEIRRAAAVALEQEMKSPAWPGDARQGGRGRGPGAARHGRGLPQRPISG